MNGSLFRKHNEAIRAVIEQTHHSEGTYGFMCECQLTDCQEMIDLTLAEYLESSSHPTRFLVRPQHLILGSERAVVEHERYWIVETTGQTTRVTER